MNALITMRETQNQFGDLVDSLEHSYINFWQRVFNISLMPLPNCSSVESLSMKNLDLIIFSGGGSVPSKYILNVQKQRVEQPNRDIMESELLKRALCSKIPIIGICRGMQYINCLLGGSVLSLLARHKVGTDHEIVTETGEKYTVNSYHNDGVLLSNLANDLIPVAVDKNNCNLVEAFRHKTENVLGIQWHPERNFSKIGGYKYTISLLKEFIQKR